MKEQTKEQIKTQIPDQITEKIFKLLKSATGKVGFYYKNLVTGEELFLNENQAFQAASVIKLPIFAEVFRQVSLGALDMSEKITVHHSDKMPSCGALNSFTDEPSIDIKTLCNLMITISDNTATNLLINRFGIDELNKGFQQLGLKETKLKRLLFDAAASKAGKENVFVPKEIGGLLESLYKKEFINSEISEEIINTLLRQQINHKIPGKLPRGIKSAHKTGEDSGITNDVGIVFGKEPFVIVFASNETDVPTFEEIIREITALLA